MKTYNISAPPVAETVDIIVDGFRQLLADLEMERGKFSTHAQ